MRPPGLVSSTHRGISATVLKGRHTATSMHRRCEETFERTINPCAFGQSLTGQSPSSSDTIATSRSNGLSPLLERPRHVGMRD